MKAQKRRTYDEVITKLNDIEKLLRKKRDKPLNFNQAAEYLGFSHSYLYKLTSRKIIPCHRPTGKMLFFSKAELDDWVFGKEQSEGPHPGPLPKGEGETEEEEDDDEGDISIMREVTSKGDSASSAE